MSAAKPDHTRKSNSKATIFVVDDEPMLLELATVILEPLGYSIKTFRNPDAAIQSFAAAKPPPALIITDYAMHTRNGMDLIHECRNLQPGQKIILVSGTVTSDVYTHDPVKPDRFLPKPYHSKQLVDAVEALIGK